MPLNPDKPKSTYQQELERRANDLLRVFNPLDEDYIIEYDRRGGTKLFRVPAKQEAVYPRYIAEKYIHEMYDKIVISDADEAVRKENAKRIASGMAAMDKTLKTGEQQQFESKFYIGNDQRAREIVSLLYMGIESEFGIDRVVSETQTNDDRPSFVKALEEVQSEKGTDVSPRVETPVNVENTKQETGDPLMCTWPDCGFVAKSNIGLISHKRTHRENKVEVI